MCGIIYSLFFLLFKDWRKVFYVLIGGSGLALIIIWIFIYDSPRIYINNKNFEKAHEILEGISKFNGKLDSFRESTKKEFYKNFKEDVKNTQEIEENKKMPKEDNKVIINIKKENKSNPKPFIIEKNEPQGKYII